MNNDTTFYNVKMYILTKATDDEIQEMYDYARVRRNELGAMNASQFKNGDYIMFDGGRGRGMIHGTFVRLLQKNAVVKDKMGLEWRVSPNLLQADPNPPAGLSGQSTRVTIVP